MANDASTKKVNTLFNSVKTFEATDEMNKC